MTASLAGLSDRITHHRLRVLQDALTEALGGYWLRRAAAFEAARPRPSDFHGSAAPTELQEQDRRCAEAARLCRHRATLSLETLGGPIEADVRAVLDEVVT